MCAQYDIISVKFVVLKMYPYVFYLFYQLHGFTQAKTEGKMFLSVIS